MSPPDVTCNPSRVGVVIGAGTVEQDAADGLQDGLKRREQLRLAADDDVTVVRHRRAGATRQRRPLQPVHREAIGAFGSRRRDYRSR